MRALQSQAISAARFLLLQVEAADAETSGRLLGELSDTSLYERIVATILCSVVRQSARQRGLHEASSGAISGQLFELERFRLPEHERFALAQKRLDELLGVVEVAGKELSVPYAALAIEEIGGLYERLITHKLVRQAGERRLVIGQARKGSGTYFTPTRLTEQVVAKALAALDSRLPADAAVRPLLELRVCDPALGGGAFLLEVCRQLSERLDRERQRTGLAADPIGARRAVATRCLAGIDLSPLAVASAEASLWLLVADPSLRAGDVSLAFRVGDTVFGFEWVEQFRAFLAGRHGFDLVIGNPPWVAYAGRAAQPLGKARRAFFQANYRAFRGYPTLHGLFVERSAALAPQGVIALVIPSAVADLDGYRGARIALTRAHAVCEPLLEFGQDAFESVTQPCIALIAQPMQGARASDRPWKLEERQHAHARAEELRSPELLERLTSSPCFPPELFGEMGFQTTSEVSRSMLLRAEQPHGEFSYPLLQGRDVAEFRERAPKLFLKADRERLRRLKCRLREPREYERVRFVVRQTAKVTIAALHSGVPFRNSLLAGFAHAVFSPELMVALLNSALYRALHLARQRDARQAVFPQVKIRHLRALPAPPGEPLLLARLAELTRTITAGELTSELRNALDDAVFDLFGVAAIDRSAILDFLGKLAPELGHSPRTNLVR